MAQCRSHKDETHDLLCSNSYDRQRRLKEDDNNRSVLGCLVHTVSFVNVGCDILSTHPRVGKNMARAGVRLLFTGTAGKCRESALPSVYITGNVSLSFFLFFEGVTKVDKGVGSGQGHTHTHTHTHTQDLMCKVLAYAQRIKSSIFISISFLFTI